MGSRILLLRALCRSQMRRGGWLGQLLETPDRDKVAGIRSGGDGVVVSE
jgi:hypothetical protein